MILFDSNKIVYNKIYIDLEKKTINQENIIETFITLTIIFIP